MRRDTGRPEVHTCGTVLLTHRLPSACTRQSHGRIAASMCLHMHVAEKRMPQLWVMKRLVHLTADRLQSLLCICCILDTHASAPQLSACMILVRLDPEYRASISCAIRVDTLPLQNSLMLLQAIILAIVSSSVLGYALLLALIFCIQVSPCSCSCGISTVSDPWHLRACCPGCDVCAQTPLLKPNQLVLLYDAA